MPCPTMLVLLPSPLALMPTVPWRMRSPFTGSMRQRWMLPLADKCRSTTDEVSGASYLPVTLRYSKSMPPSFATDRTFTSNSFFSAVVINNRHGNFVGS